MRKNKCGHFPLQQISNNKVAEGIFSTQRRTTLLIKVKQKKNQKTQNKLNSKHTPKISETSQKKNLVEKSVTNKAEKY